MFYMLGASLIINVLLVTGLIASSIVIENTTSDLRKLRRYFARQKRREENGYEFTKDKKSYRS